MNQNQPFRQHHITRALKAAAAAGVRDPHLKIRLPNGTELHIGGAGSKPETATPKPKTRQRTPTRGRQT